MLMYFVQQPQKKTANSMNDMILYPLSYSLLLPTQGWNKEKWRGGHARLNSIDDRCGYSVKRKKRR